MRHDFQAEINPSLSKLHLAMVFFKLRHKLLSFCLFIFLCVYGCLASMYVYGSHFMPSAGREQKAAPDPLGLKLKTVVSYQVGTGT